MSEQRLANARTVCAHGLRLAPLLPMVFNVRPANAVEWLNSGTGDWSDPAGWDTGSVPTSTDVSVVVHGGSALSAAADMVRQTFATLGMRGAYQFVVGQGGLATFSGGIGWRRGFGEAPTAQLGFLGGSPFSIAATPAATNSLQLETGFDLDLASGFDPSVGYGGDISAGAVSHGVHAGIGGRC